MKNSQLDVLIWVLVYGGLLTVCLGLFVQRCDGGFGVSLVVVGAVLAAAGAFLVWLRAQRGP